MERYKEYVSEVLDWITGDVKTNFFIMMVEDKPTAVKCANACRIMGHTVEIVAAGYFYQMTVSRERHETHRSRKDKYNL